MQYVLFKSEFWVQAQAGQGRCEPGAARQEDDTAEPVEDEMESNAVTQPPPAREGDNNEAQEAQKAAKPPKATEVVKRKADETAEKPRKSGRKR